MNDLEKYKHFLNEMNIKFTEHSSEYNGDNYIELRIDEQHIQTSYGNSLSIDFVNGCFENFEAWGE